MERFFADQSSNLTLCSEIRLIETCGVLHQLFYITASRFSFETTGLGVVYGPTLNTNPSPRLCLPKNEVELENVKDLITYVGIGEEYGTGH